MRRPDALLRGSAFGLAVVVLAGIAAAFVLARDLTGGPGVVGDPLPRGDLVVDVAVVAAGLVLTTARPRNSIGWVMLLFALMGAAQNTASVYGVRAAAMPEEGLPLGPLALSLGASLWVLGLFLLTPVLLLLYPAGRLPSAAWRWAVAVGALGAALLAVGQATSPDATDDFVQAGRPVAELPDAATSALQVSGAILLFGAALAALLGTVARAVRAVASERLQLLWLLLAGATLLVLAVVEPPAWLLTAGLALVPVAVTAGILAHGLLGIEVAVRGTLLYGVLTALVLALYVGTTAAVSAVVPTGSIPVVVAAAVVAVLLAPARTWLQRWVDRLVRGPRTDPLVAVGRVGAELAAPAADPLPAVLQALAGALRARCAAVVDPSGTVLAQAGDDSGPRVLRPLTVGGERVGDLVLVPTGRGGDAALDERVLDALAGPVAVVVRARRLDREVAAAREGLVSATLDERARIRRDLHDGLGPTLSGVVLGLDAVSATVREDPDAAVQITARLRREAEGAVEEVRRIIDALRPSALDGRGLVPALRERAATVGLRRSLTVAVEAPERMPPLPPQVEAAAFRIADEAVNNVVRHAGATRCVVRVIVSDELTVEVRDDGRGLPDRLPGEGVGLTSMRVRAEELGGSFEVRTGRSGGSVVARLPLEVPWQAR